MERTHVADMLDAARRALFAERVAAGHWEGHLSSSALSTAVAVFALHRMDPVRHAGAIRAGLEWLVQHANADGGWGDTVDSFSNVSTTLLCWSALAAAQPPMDAPARQACLATEAWLTRRLGATDPERVAAAIVKHYGDDRTFAVPILTMCALAGRLGAGGHAWRYVPQLPFELARVPHQFFRWLRLPVVSYAIPALIAIGLVRHRQGPGSLSPLRALRGRLAPGALHVLQRLQPADGGFLEATPLTAFVVMSLAGSGLTGHPVAQAGLHFLLAAQRLDGSWPIDVNLATWVTTLAVNALDDGPGWVPDEAVRVRGWLLAQQWRAEHPFTHAAPGGWAWTDLSGGVPDADDTSGALLALRRLGPPDDGVRQAARAGILWLLDLQNGDGGFPTFCRGWGRLPFDRSCPDLTAHALRALVEWSDEMDAALRRRMDGAVRRSLRWLRTTQRSDGAWCPLWFGCQTAPGAENLTYGTAQVLRALNALAPQRPELAGMRSAGISWLLGVQRADGGWGGAGGADPSIEETALAVTALADAGARPAAERGVQWLSTRTDGGRVFPSAPIGLYFASLWYAERLYPLVFTVSALRAVQRMLNRNGLEAVTYSAC